MTADEFIARALRARRRRGDRHGARARRARLGEDGRRQGARGGGRGGGPATPGPSGRHGRIDEATVCEPDASLRCGPKLDEDALELRDPLVVVEVLSRSFRAQDTGAKLEAYFRLPSVRHYLIVNAATRAVIHHARGAASSRGAIATRIHDGHAGGELRLDPPGLTLRPAGFFARL